MLDPLLEMLRCPIDRSLLSLAQKELVHTLNRAIRGGRIHNQAGKQVEKVLDGGLIRAAGDLLYPIQDQIPVLLSEEAISLDQLTEGGDASAREAEE